MTFIPYGTTVPTLTPNQWQFAGVKFGGGDSFVSGDYGLAVIMANDPQRPLTGGEFRGVDVPSGRDMAVTFNVVGTSAADLDSKRLALFAVLQANGNTEQPLFFQTPGGTTYGCMARVRKAPAPVDLMNVQAWAFQFAVMFRCSDWRIYGTPTKHATATFSATPASASCVVGGGAYASPLIIITAGASGCIPKITSGSIIDLDFTPMAGPGGLGSADTLTLDLDHQTAIWNTGAALIDALSLLAYPAAWGPLPAATTTSVTAVDVSGGGGTSTLEVQFADAFAGV